MGLHGDETGFFWHQPPRAARGGGGASLPILNPPKLPESSWVPPSELPQLKGRKFTRAALDIEANDPQLTELGCGVRRGAYMAGIAFGIEDGPRWYFPMRHEGGGNLDPDLVERWAREELNSVECEIVGAKLEYDLDHMFEIGVTFPNAKRFLDVQIAEPLLNEHRLRYALEVLSVDYLGEGKDEDLLRQAAATYGWRTDKQVKSNIHRLPSSHVGPYAEGDIDRPLRILRLQETELEKQDLLRVWDMETRLTPLLVHMRRRGVRVNLEKAEIARKKLTEQRDKWLGVIHRMVGTNATFGTPGQIGPVLERDGLDVPRTPTSGQYSLQKWWLEKHQAHPICEAVLAGRRVNTVLNTFIEGIFKHAINGRVHATLNQLKGDGAGTIARLSCTDPNLQNQPARDEELGPMTRDIFEPDEDEDWESQDASQIEYRMLVHYAVGAGASEARKRYNEDPSTDFHNMAGDFLGIDGNDKFLRKRLKNTNFCKVYGGGGDKLAATAGCTLEEALGFMETYDRAFPFVKETFDLANNRASQRGYITTLLGRRQRFPTWEPAGNYKGSPKYVIPARSKEEARERWPNRRLVRAETFTGLNKLLQCGAADIIKKCMVDCYDAGVWDYLGPQLLSVHDENNWSVPRTKEAREAAAEASRIFARAIPLKVPLLIGVERGPSWGRLIKVAA